jgi:amino acid adenylation domain-containing protein/non-ribosomal peptide synthase protein (TIGR01720 family)
MVPQIWVELTSIPLTANGKIDRKALPEPELTELTAEYVAPRNETELKLTAIWQKLLGQCRIGIYDNFFELGGHSLLAMRVVSAVRRELEVELEIRDLFVHPDIAGLSTYLDRQNKGSVLPAIIAEERPAHIPLSFSQERLWFIDKLEGSVQYHIPEVLRLHGEIKYEILEKALRGIINRHEVLRTVILEDAEGRGYQQVMPADGWKLKIIEATGAHKETEGITRLISELISRPFDLSGDYMLHAELIKLNTREHVLVVTMHHIASDGWSTSVLVKEVIALYEGYINNTAPTLSVLNIQYADYAIWQRKYLQGEQLEAKLAYWKSKLEDVEALQLPVDHNRAPEGNIRGAMQSFHVDKGLSDKLQSLSHQHGATLYMTLLAAFKVLLYRYSGQEDICVGTPVAGRNHQELEGLIGFFINTLALRDQVKGETSFIALLNQVKETTLEAFNNQEAPFEKVVDAVVKERDLSKHPLFQVLFVFQNTPEIPQLQLNELKLTAENYEHTTTQFDLSFQLTETNKGLKVVVTYSTDLYAVATIERMISHYVNLLSSIIASPETAAGKLGMLSAAEETMLLDEFNNTNVEYPKDKSIVDLFEEQAVQNPEAIAIVFEEERLTYKVLNERANQLARYLQKRGVKAETLVPICVERSLEMIVGILGILKAGGAYVPIDPEYPQDRVNYMLEDTCAALVVSSRASSSKLSEKSIIITLDEDWAKIAEEQNINLHLSISIEQLAYVIYTSGSTGRPKGVMIKHRGVFSSTLARNRYYHQAKSQLLISSYSFDSSVAVIFGTLTTGGNLILIKDELIKNAESIRELLNLSDTILCVPSYYRFLLEENLLNDSNLSRVILAGEKLNNDLVRLHYKETDNISLFNEYGPTENTVWTSVAEIKQAEEKITIGKPISNTNVYILSKDDQLVPLGVTGELLVGGLGLARGYLNNSALTDEKFVDNPLNKKNVARLYRTGDLGRWLPDGNIEYLGRVDDQVKIRGYRIELGEIENILNESSLVKQGVILAKEDKKGNNRLVGYVVPEETFDKQAIQIYLQTKLPDYMVPSVWVELEAIPLTSNGKVDKKALPEPDLADAAVYAAPRNVIEEALATIWRELLGQERVGIYDNFFELGGDSILTIQLVSRMRRLGYTVQPRDIFNNQDIAGLSAVIGHSEGSDVAAEQGELSGSFGLLPIQSWYLEKQHTEISHFNQSVLLKVKKTITADQLQMVLDELVSYHDALRLTFTKENNEWIQTYGSARTLLIVDNIHDAPQDRLTELVGKKAELYQRSLSITEGRLMQTVLMKTPESEEANRLLLVIHHLVIDGVSWRIFLTDLEQLLSRYEVDKTVTLGQKGSSYRQWQSALVKYGQSQHLLGQRIYWEEIVSNYSPFLHDTHRSTKALVKDMLNCQVKFEAEQTNYLLHEIPKVYHTEINDLLLAALGATLSKWSGKDQVVIGLEGHGREELSRETDVSGTVGWFTSLYPVLLKSNTGADAQIKGIKEQLRRVPDKGIGYGVLKYINKTNSLQGSDPWDLIFNYLGQLDTAVENGNLITLTGEERGTEIAGEQLSSSNLSVNSHIFEGELVLNWSYSSLHYDRKTIINIAGDYINQLLHLISHCIEKGKSGSVFTPSDYGLGDEVSYEELDRFLKERYMDDDIMSF